MSGSINTDLSSQIYSFSRHTGKLPIHGDSAAKAALYRDRFQLLQKRLSRDKLFSKPAFDVEITYSGSYEVCPNSYVITIFMYIPKILKKLYGANSY